MRSSIAYVLLTLSAASVAEAQDDRYLLLATERTGTMQQEINAAAARGFRVVAASPKESSEVVVLLEQTTGKYAYRLVAAARTATLQRRGGPVGKPAGNNPKLSASLARGEVIGGAVKKSVGSYCCSCPY
jgi:hypothetical protein